MLDAALRRSNMYPMSRIEERFKGFLKLQNSKINGTRRVSERAYALFKKIDQSSRSIARSTLNVMCPALKNPYRLPGMTSQRLSSFSNLPSEIIGLILGCLGFQDRLGMRMVCRRFKLLSMVCKTDAADFLEQSHLRIVGEALRENNLEKTYKFYFQHAKNSKMLESVIDDDTSRVELGEPHDFQTYCEILERQLSKFWSWTATKTLNNCKNIIKERNDITSILAYKSELFMGLSNGTIEIWDVSQKDRSAILPAPAGTKDKSVTHLVVWGDYLLSGLLSYKQNKKIIQFWDRKTRKCMRTWEASLAYVNKTQLLKGKVKENIFIDCTHQWISIEERKKNKSHVSYYKFPEQPGAYIFGDTLISVTHTPFMNIDSIYDTTSVSSIATTLLWKMKGVPAEELPESLWVTRLEPYPSASFL